MGLPLKNLAKQVTKLGFDLASDIQTSGTYKQIKTANYNAQSGEVANQFTTASISAMMTSFSQKETDGTIVRIGDKRILIRADQLKDSNSLAIAPTSDDVFTVSSSEVWKLLSFTLDATKTLYIFHARRIVAA